MMGHPVSHSLSPAIHTLFAEQTGEPVFYQAIAVEPGDFSNALLQFRDAGGKGLSITLPFKPDAFAASEQLTQRARRAGAVNTIWFDEQARVHGDNTDGIGLATDIRDNHGIPIGGSRILILGAGGAVQGIIGPLLAEAPACIVIANRTISKARDLVKAFAGDGELSARGFDELADASFDIVINGTSASLNATVPPIPASVFADDALAYDLMYSTGATVFQSWSRDHGVKRSLDGLGMLVEQAAEAFCIWRGVRPETQPVINMLRGGW